VVKFYVVKCLRCSPTAYQRNSYRLAPAAPYAGIARFIPDPSMAHFPRPRPGRSRKTCKGRRPRPMPGVRPRLASRGGVARLFQMLTWQGPCCAFSIGARLAPECDPQPHVRHAARGVHQVRCSDERCGPTLRLCDSLRSFRVKRTPPRRLRRSSKTCNIKAPKVQGARRTPDTPEQRAAPGNAEIARFTAPPKETTQVSAPSTDSKSKQLACFGMRFVRVARPSGRTITV